METQPTYRLGDTVVITGYADDFEGEVTAVRFSLDEGEHWTTYPVDEATLPQGVSWTLRYTPPVAGSYLLRATSLSGTQESSVVTTFAFAVLDGEKAGLSPCASEHLISRAPESSSTLSTVASLDNPDSSSRQLCLRPFGVGGSGTSPQLFRSRALHFATPQDLARLVHLHHIQSIYDIRSEREVSATDEPYLTGVKTIALKPTEGKKKEADKWLRAGVIGKYGAPEERMIANYRHYVDDYPIIGAALRGIATEGVPALIHCENGKDRTGVLCATILYAAGASWETIMTDYLATNEVNAQFITEEAERLGEGMTPEERTILMSFLEARPAYLEAFFDEAKRRYGSLERYLTQGLRLTDDHRASLSVLAGVDKSQDFAGLLWRQSQRGHTRLEDAAFWDNKASRYDQSVAEDRFIADLLPHLGLHGGETVLDMGCGTGMLTCLLAEAGHRVFAADFSAGMLAVAEKKLHMQYPQARGAVTFHQVAWDGNWQATGIMPKSVDVALAIRSFSTEQLAEGLEKLTTTARKRALVVLHAKHSPRVMPELLAALGLAAEETSDTELIMAHLRMKGYSPKQQLFVQERQRKFATRPDAEDWAIAMVTLTGIDLRDASAASLHKRLNIWLDEHLVPTEDEQKPFVLDIPQTNHWAIINWDCSAN